MSGTTNEIRKKSTVQVRRTVDFLFDAPRPDRRFSSGFTEKFRGLTRRGWPILSRRNGLAKNNTLQSRQK